MATGYYDQDGFWVYGEDDLADEGGGFSGVLNKAAKALPGAVSSRVNKQLASDATIRQAAVAAASAAVDEELTDTGVVTGAKHTGAQTGTVWAQTTRPDGNGQVKRLPLGYRADGHLDEFAQRIFREDIRGVVRGVDPIYSYVRTTPEGKILYAEKWDGTVVIPGLAGAAVPPSYADVPYRPGAAIRPVYAEKDAVIYGSSSAFALASELAPIFTGAGRAFFNGAANSEVSSHTVARIGSEPARLTFPSNTLPASGTVTVTASVDAFGGSGTRNIPGTVAGIPGTLTWTSSGVSWTRTTAGAAITVPADVPHIPDAGTLYRARTAFFQIGKTDLLQTLTAGRPTVDVLKERTKRAVDYLVPLHKRLLICNHFVNTNTPASSASRDRTLALNAWLAEQYGAMVIDLYGYSTGSQVWADYAAKDPAFAGPTSTDLSQQALGNKPPSLSLDDQHFTVVANQLLANKLIAPMLTNYGWMQ